MAKSSELPTPAGPPSTSRPIRAVGSDVANASWTASASVTAQHTPAWAAGSPIAVGVRRQNQGGNEPAGVVDREY